jgi:hypothetical protein
MKDCSSGPSVPLLPPLSATAGRPQWRLARSLLQGGPGGLQRGPTGQREGPGACRWSKAAMLTVTGLKHARPVPFGHWPFPLSLLLPYATGCYYVLLADWKPRLAAALCSR